jgi:ribosomal protein S5
VMKEGGVRVGVQVSVWVGGRRGSVGMGEGGGAGYGAAGEQAEMMRMKSIAAVI